MIWKIKIAFILQITNTSIAAVQRRKATIFEGPQFTKHSEALAKAKRKCKEKLTPAEQSILEEQKEEKKSKNNLNK